MAKLWCIKFEVKAKNYALGFFPLDMLRYDCCTPSSGEDVAKIPIGISDIPEVPEVITLVHYSHGYKGWQPTVDRWKSFGWEVVKVHPAYSL